MAASKREQLIKTAQNLFSKYGFHAVGIDTILEESGVAKRTLYNHFRSKEELILAVLRYYDQRFRNELMRAVEGRAADPRKQLLALFDFAEEMFGRKDFYGCMFVGAIGEYPEGERGIRNICREFKGLLLEYIAGLAEGAKCRQPRRLAEQLLLLFEGAITMAQINRSDLSARQAKTAARILIENSLS